MGSALRHLLGLRDAEDRHDIPPEDLRSLQMDAANERFESRIDEIPLLKNRATAAGLSKLSEPADLVPVLFAHNTYKTYSEPWLSEGQWDRMARWLQTISTYQVDGAKFDDVGGLDDFVRRIQEQGTYVACSSGTTGKPAMLASAKEDLEFASQGQISALAWATGVKPDRDRKFFGLGPRTDIARNEHTRETLIDAYALPDEEPYQLPVPLISVEAMMDMIVLRRRISEGTALASEVSQFESLSGERQANMEAAQVDAIEALIAARDRKLFLAGFFASLHPLAVGIRDRGYSGKDFQSDTVLFTGGGLKGAQLPPDFREFVFDTFNLSDDRVFHLYSMQELNTPMPRCSAHRYHVPPWLVALPLDEPGEQLLDVSAGEIEARAAFFDLSLEGRWGGIISGDKVQIDFGRCECGHQGPTIGTEIVRFADLASGDKITCAGTIDAYVKGAA